MARPSPRRDARAKTPATLSASGASVFRQNTKVSQKTDRYTIAKRWQIDAYRYVNLIGEARYAAALFAAIASRAEIGVSEPQTIGRKAVWVTSGPEVDAFAEVAPNVRARSKLIRDYMLHRVIAGECYLIARMPVDTDPSFALSPNVPLWQIAAVTELRRIGDRWEVRHENGNYLPVADDLPIIRLWDADPENAQEAWSPFRSMLPTLREIEFYTKHIFAQVRSRLISAGVWFLPDNLTFAPPAPEMVPGGAEAISNMNEAEQFMVSLAAASMQELDDDEVAFPTVVMAAPESLPQIDQSKLIQFWAGLDDKAMIQRSDAVRRFALGMDMPPEQILGSSGLAVTGAGGSAGSVNHWGVWANEEQTISAHIEPALDDFTATLTTSFLALAIDGTDKVIAYDTASLRLRQDRSKEAIELHDRGLLSGAVVLRENGFDPEADMMTPAERRDWLMARLAGGSATPELVQAALLYFGAPVEDVQVSGNDSAPEISDRNGPRSLDSHPYEGPPRVQHDQSPAPFSALHASAEGLVLRALEKAGNRLLNEGKRGKDRDRTTPAHLAHLTASLSAPADGTMFDFSMAPAVLLGLSAASQARWSGRLSQFCARLYNDGEPYSREALIEALEDLA